MAAETQPEIVIEVPDEWDHLTEEEKEAWVVNFLADLTATWE